MANETAAIWQVQSGAADGAEATATDTHTIDFNPDDNDLATNPMITNVSVSFRRAVPENEAVDADNNELQDMGLEGLDVTIAGIIGDTNNDASTEPVNKLSKWLQDGNETTGYTKGRYGLRIDASPQWNVVPTSTYGYHIKDIQMDYTGDDNIKTRFTIRLALGGDLASAV